MEELGVQATETARLVIALFVLPGIIYFGRRLRAPAGGGFYMATVIAVYLSYGFTIVEEFWLPELFHTMQHLSLALAGLFAVVAAIYTRREAKEKVSQ